MKVTEPTITETESNFIFLSHLEECGEEFLEFTHYPHPFGDDFWVGSNDSICEVHGHDLCDESFGGPDHGNMDHSCKRCGRYWSVPLY